MSESKDAQYYLTHPEELSNLSDEQLESLAYNKPADPAQQGDTNGTATPASTSDDQSKAVAEPAKAIEAAPVVAEPKGAEPKGDVQSRDGKHTIPFSVLEAARDKANTEAQARQAAESRAAELEVQTKALQAQIDAAKAGKATGADVEAAAKQMAETVTEAELASIESDYPAMAKAVRIQMAMVQSLQSQLAKVTQAEATREAETASETAMTVQDIIDANPKLSQLQASDPQGWQAAIALDDQFKSDSKLRTLSTAERFEKVVKAYEAVHGEIVVQGNATATQTSTQQTQQAAPAAKTKPAAPAVPTSMSAIPGGTPPAVDASAALLALNGTQAMAHFANMTREQIEAQLDKL